MVPPATCCCSGVNSCAAKSRSVNVSTFRPAAVTAAVREAGADYVLALKGNRSALHQHVEQLFAEAEANGYPGVKQFESCDAAPGRTERRIVRAMPP